MPLELIPGMDREKKLLGPGDRGFIVSLAKTRFNKQAIHECVKLFRKYAGLYYKEKCPELAEQEKAKEDKEEDEPMDVKEETTEEAGGDTADQTEVETAASEEGTKGDEKKSAKSETKPQREMILFVPREMVYQNCGFIASNLAHPGDYAHFIMTKLGEAGKNTRTRFPFRIMPVDIVCEAKTRVVEKQIIPLFETVFGVDDEPVRFSLMYRGSNEGGGGMSQHEAAGIVRNCVWSVNPNCVHCIKYQDYAIMIDILSPLFCVGIAKEFQRLAGYNTWSIRGGIIYTELDTDSEDEISDDPTLDEEEEKRRKLRIKRKRRAQKAGLTQHDGEPKKSTDGGDEEEEGNEEGEGGEEDEDALLEDDANGGDGDGDENGV